MVQDIQRLSAAEYFLQNSHPNWFHFTIHIECLPDWSSQDARGNAGLTTAYLNTFRLVTKSVSFVPNLEDMRRLSCEVLVLLTLSVGISNARAQNLTVKGRGIFTPQNKPVLLLSDSVSDKSFIVFKTKLQVNTDGTPLSYHPNDLSGSVKALNNICNAVAIYKVGQPTNLCLSKGHYREAIAVFKKFRDANFDSVPNGYKIIWKNVLAPTLIGGKVKPCVFTSGEYKGYFGSLTSLKNGVDDKGECECMDQVNPLKIPGLVLVGGSDNIVYRFGARKGDLVIVYSPKTKNIVFAIINDLGPRHNLGEGSVLLNMRLLGTTEYPKTRKETYKLATDHDVLVAIAQGSKNFHLQRPYSAVNIEERIIAWLTEMTIREPEELIRLIEKADD